MDGPLYILRIAALCFLSWIRYCKLWSHWLGSSVMQLVLGWPPLSQCPACAVCPNWILHLSSQAFDSHCLSLMTSVNWFEVPLYLGISPFPGPSHQSLAKSCWVFFEWCILSIIPFLLSLLSLRFCYVLHEQQLSTIFIHYKIQTKRVTWNPRPFPIWPKPVIYCNSVVRPLLQSSASYKLYSRER